MTMESEPRQEAAEPRNAAKSGRRGPSAGLIAAVLLAVFVLVFAIQNETPATIDFLVVDWKTTVRFAILIAVALGVVLDRMFDYGMKRRKKRKLKEKLKELD